MPDPHARPTGPTWARPVHRYYDPSFDIRSRAEFQAALDDFVSLSDEERAFHQTHLLYRVVQGLESLHGDLQRIAGRLDLLADADLSALEHLEPIREAVEDLAHQGPGWASVEAFDGEQADDLREEDDEGQDPDDDPDFLYEPIPEAPPRPAPARRTAAAPPRPPDPEREALVGDLVPATEGPHAAEAGGR